MKAEIFALATAVTWAVGSYFAKKGMYEAKLDPVAGLAIRLVASAVIILVIAAPLLVQITEAAKTTSGRHGLLYILIFEGVVAGLIGMILYYTALKQGQLSRVMPIAFTAPLFGFILGIMYMGEELTMMKSTGAALTLIGIIILTAF